MPSADFPRLFEAHYQRFDQDLPLWRALARKYPGPILELGCGTGRVLLALAGEGFQVEGLDRDPDMLDRARARLRTAQAVDVRLHPADLAHFSLGRSFSLVLVPCNTLAMLTDDDLRSGLAAIRTHLLPGGVLAAELPHPSEARSAVSDELTQVDAFIEEESGHPVQVSARQTILTHPLRAEIDWIYDELLPDGRVLRTEVPVTYFLREQQDLEAMLGAAGFGPWTFQADYEGSPLDSCSTQMIVIAKVT
jgi:SAM-dependent methyltransferase